MAGSLSCTTRSSVARRRRPAPRSSSNHAARRAATAARVASVALGRCRSACHGWPPTRTLAVDRSPPIPGGARRRPRFGCMKHEPGGCFHVAATEDLITEQRQAPSDGANAERSTRRGLTAVVAPYQRDPTDRRVPPCPLGARSHTSDHLPMPQWLAQPVYEARASELVRSYASSEMFQKTGAGN